MKKEEELLRDVKELVELTKGGKQQWDVQCQTTEYNDPAKKPVEQEGGKTWVIDECFVSYHCTHRDKEFLMITYEQIYTCGDKTKTINLIFTPPLSIRFFDVDILAPYAVEADQMLIYEAHVLWETVLERYKQEPEEIQLTITPRELILP